MAVIGSQIPIGDLDDVEAYITGRFGEGSVEKFIISCEERKAIEENSLGFVNLELGKAVIENEVVILKTKDEDKKQSWASVLGRKAVSYETPEYIEPTLVEGKPVVHVTLDELVEVKEKFSDLVVGCFIGRRPSYLYTKEACARQWKIKDFIMQAYGDTKFTFKFGNDEEKRSVLEIGSFHIASQLFIVRPWKLFVEA
ncbi:hypothetical protein FRX31_034406 [Thalictrum thalictroides]|uniref:DUF4283 domain-containing protein n=1 Tax=Thalictrum thalictroides TaxID=46969 RepID=A0A7J6UUZ1_THATH|nr:hypothetical protein FRX31_034406 [Thalictrum thalictroides]